MAINKVVVKYLDGRILKGSTLDFDPMRDFFHLDVIETNEEDGALGMREIDISKLKAIFFVKDFAGRPDYKERDEFLPGDERPGKRLVIEFSNGEELLCLSNTYHIYSRDSRYRRGFFVSPADPESNNLRIFINTATVKRITPLP